MIYIKIDTFGFANIVKFMVCFPFFLLYFYTEFLGVKILTLNYKY